MEQWKAFAAAAGLQVPDMNLEVIAPSLDRLFSATREALKADYGFQEPVICFRFPGGRP